MHQQLSECVHYFQRLLLNDLPVGWIAGGAVRDYFSIGRCTSDVDVFFSSKDNFDIALKYFADHDIKPTFQNERVTNLIYKKHKIQLISSHYFQSPEDTIKAFDFTVCSAAVDRAKVYHHETFFMDLAKKRLVIVSVPYPLSTLQRLQKYIRKGYSICNGGLLEIAKAIQALDLQSPSQNTFEFYPDGEPKFVRID